MRARPRPLLVTCVSACLASAPITVATPTFAAAPPEPDAEPGAAAADGDDLSRAKQLFDAGVARYTAADYEAAVDLWLEAYSLVPPSYDNRLILAELIYNVARAQQKWFEIDRDVKHLRQAREILTRYHDEIGELYPAEQVELERERIAEQISELDRKIADAEAEQARKEAELAERMRPTFDEEADAREARRNKAMVGAGAGLTVIGLGGIGMVIAGVTMAASAEDELAGLPLETDIPAREAAIDRGLSANALMLTGTLAGAVFLAAGVPLLGVGLSAERKRKNRRAEAGLERARVDGLAPVWIPGGAGLTLSGAF